MGKLLGPTKSIYSYNLKNKILLAICCCSKGIRAATVGFGRIFHKNVAWLQVKHGICNQRSLRRQLIVTQRSCYYQRLFSSALSFYLCHSLKEVLDTTAFAEVTWKSQEI